MLDVADVNVSLGDLEAAMLLLEKAVSSLDKIFGVQNEVTLSAMDKLCTLYRNLGLCKESRQMSGKMIPHCRTLFGIYNPITRGAVTRYISAANRIDYPPEVTSILALYKRSRDPKCLHIVDHLGRAHMRAGLMRDAASIYEKLLRDLIDVKGLGRRATFKALGALCICRESLGDMQQTIDSYAQLVQMAYDADKTRSWRKIAYVENKIVECTEKRRLLEEERAEWRLDDPDMCVNCGRLTSNLCACEFFLPYI